MKTTVAVIAAHGDDEVLGCGGTMARLARDGAEVHVLLLADGEMSRGVASGERDALVAARNRSADAAGRTLGAGSVECVGLPDNRMDGVELLDIVQHIERFMARHRPDAVFTHHAGDVNVDHRVTHDAVLAACRPQPGHHVRELLFFEVPSSTEWRPPASGTAFTPNWYVDISQTLPAKLAALRDYDTEMRPFPHPRSYEAVEALARWRGASAGVNAAEAFILGRKIL